MNHRVYFRTSRSHPLGTSPLMTSKDLISIDVTNDDQDSKASKPFPLQQLPLELRRQIYHYHLMLTRHPPPKAIYFERECSRDPPSPLLSVSSQVRAEVLDLVQTWPIYLRVTRHGTRLGNLAETWLIAQQHSRDHGSIIHIVVEIWPPLEDRPVDMIDTWRHLRAIRMLCAIPRLKKITVFFSDNEMASWLINGHAISLLNCLTSYRHQMAPFPENDVAHIMNLFSRMSPVNVCFQLPLGLGPGKPTEGVLHSLPVANEMMMGLVPNNDQGYSDDDEDEVKYQNVLDLEREDLLRQAGAAIAVQKLDIITERGAIRLTQAQWEDFIGFWSPDFSMLRDGWKGKLHYVQDEEEAWHYALEDFFSMSITSHTPTDPS